MIEADARVVAVDQGWARVEVARQNACGGCSAAAGCGTSVLASWFGNRAARLQVEDRLGVQVGDSVVIGISDATLTKASLAAYLLPLAALIGAAWAAKAAGAGEVAAALAALAGLGAGLWLTGKLTGGLAGRERYRPVLLRKQERFQVVRCDGAPPKGSGH